MADDYSPWGSLSPGDNTSLMARLLMGQGPGMSDRLMNQSLIPSQPGQYLTARALLGNENAAVDALMGRPDQPPGPVTPSVSTDQSFPLWARFLPNPSTEDKLSLALQAFGAGRGAAIPRGTIRPTGDTPVYGGEVSAMSRRFELPPAPEPKMAANLNTPKIPEWQDYHPPSSFGPDVARRGNPDRGAFLADPQGKTLAEMPGYWNWNDATNSGSYSYTPRFMSPIGRDSITETMRGPTFQTREAGQAYAEAVLKSGQYKPIDPTPFMAMDEQLLRQRAAADARSQFKIVE